MPDDNSTHVAELVRAADRDRYLATLYAPKEKRGDLYALYAFNAEIAAIRDRVSEPMPGEIRLQWWRDVIADGAPSTGGGHPVAEALLATIDAHSLPRGTFDDYLEARIFDLYDDPMPSRTDLEGYCGETASALIQLASIVLDPAAASQSATLAGHAGCAQAITGLLRMLPIHRARGQCYVPRDLLTAAGIDAETFLVADPGAGGERAVAAMTALARDHLNAFRAHAATLPRELRPAYLPVALADRYLAKMERSAADPLRQTADIGEIARHVGLFRHAQRGWR